MMQPLKTAHCLFEQSGTFRDEFKKLGINAYDYDYKNDFGRTDYVMDLFREIKNAAIEKSSIFDNFKKDDLIFAFFPCVRFEDQFILQITGNSYGVREWTDLEKIMRARTFHAQIHGMYDLVCELFFICITRGLKMVLENPYSSQHYLKRYFQIKPTMIDVDRRRRGDYFKKPTQYFFVNFKPKNNVIFEMTNDNSVKIKSSVKKIRKSDYEKMGVKDRQTARSMIHPDYANRFIREFILEKET